MSTNKIRYERGNITTDTTEIQRIIRDFYEKVYDNKKDNVEEMDKFLKMYNLPRLNQEEIETIIRPITYKQIESIIKNSQTNKSLGPDGFTVNSTKHLKKN